jgi:uncharacterized membrane protein
MAQDLMSAEQLKREKDLWDQQYALANAQEMARVNRSWQALARFVPYVVGVFGVILIITMLFGAFQLWGELWMDTKWH